MFLSFCLSGFFKKFNKIVLPINFFTLLFHYIDTIVSKLKKWWRPKWRSNVEISKISQLNQRKHKYINKSVFFQKRTCWVLTYADYKRTTARQVSQTWYSLKSMKTYLFLTRGFLHECQTNITHLFHNKIYVKKWNIFLYLQSHAH